MNPLSGSLLAVVLVGVLALSNRWAVLSMVVGILFLTQGANLDLGGFNFSAVRILSYAGFARICFRKEFSWRNLTKVDKTLIALYSFTTLVLLTRPEESPALRIAKFLDVVSAYLTFRSLIVGPDDWRWLLRTLPLLLIPYVAMLGVERIAKHNYFDLVGGNGTIWLREGKVRCFGSFRHPSLLGSLGACFLPFFIAMAWDMRERARGILGIVLCLAIVGFSNSGGPMSVMAVVVAGWFLWPLRFNMKGFRWALVGFVAVMGLMMEAPIWYLLARVSSVTGGTGWHRSYLMDVAFQHFDQWCLMGMPLSETSQWFPYVIEATGGADITNQFIAFGLQGGIGAIALFIIWLTRSFSLVGRAQAFVRSDIDLDGAERLLWGFGVALAAHISNWLGITYFDQFIMLWLLQIAAMVSVSEYYLRSNGDQLLSLEQHPELFETDSLPASSRPMPQN